MKQKLRGDRKRKNCEHCLGDLALKAERTVFFRQDERPACMEMEEKSLDTASTFLVKKVKSSLL